MVKKQVNKAKLCTDFARQSLKLECMIHEKLNHPNVVRLYEYTETPTTYELIMEYVSKGSHLEEKVIEVR